MKNLKKKKSWGGARKGSGVPRGYRQKKTIAKEEAREAVRVMITGALEPMIKAQIENAKGIQHFFLRDPVTGQFQRITNPREIQKALNAKGAKEGSTFWIFTKDPNVQAFTDLMNRALDKPAEQVKVTEDVHIHIHAEIRTRLQQAKIRELELLKESE